MLANHWRRQTFNLQRGALRGTDVAGANASYLAPGGSVDYFGPDAQRILADEFVAAHCLRLVPPAPHRLGLLGVEFFPARPGQSVTEISGAFWLDTAAALLRFLDYRYSNAPPEYGEVGAGGWLEFARTGRDDWIVVRWMNRLPAGDVSARMSAVLARMGRGGATLGPLTGVSGGSVVSLDSASGGPGSGGGRVRVRIAGALEPAVAADATVEMVEAGLFAVFDSGGTATIEGVAPASYSLLVSTPAMLAMGAPAVRGVVEVGGGAAAELAVRLPSARDLVARRCGPSAQARGTATVFGALPVPQVSAGSGATSPPSIVELSWLLDTDRSGPQLTTWLADSAALAQGGSAPGIRVVMPDIWGHWYACDVPGAAAVRVVVLATATQPQRVFYGRVGAREVLVRFSTARDSLP